MYNWRVVKKALIKCDFIKVYMKKKVLLLRSLVIMYFEQSYHLQLESASYFREFWKARVNRWCVCDTIR